MTEHQTGDDMRLLSLAYVEALLKEDEQAARYLERDGRQLARCIGGLAFFLMDLVVIPVENGIGWEDGWIEVDFRRRTDPDFRANLFRRSRYRRMAHGLSLLPRQRARRVAHECIRMLAVAYVTEYGRDELVTVREGGLKMVDYFRTRFCHSSDATKNA